MSDVASPGIVTSVEKLSCYDMYFEYFVESTYQIYPGIALAVMPDGGLAPADTAGALYTAGRAAQTVLGTGSAGPTCRVDQGIFRWANGTGTVAASNRGQTCYWQDDQTVTMTPGTLEAGIVESVDSQGVWVLTGLGLTGSSEPSVATPVTVSVLISTATGGAYYLASPVAGTIVGLQTVLQAAITTGNAVVTPSLAGTAVTSGAVTIVEVGSAAGQVNTATPTAANVVAVGTPIKLAITGTASTQNAIVNILIQPNNS